MVETNKTDGTSLETHSLERWEIASCEPSTEIPPSIPVNLRDWIAAAAPGDTYLALHAADRLPHPFERENELACAWVADREWWWRTSFDAVPAQQGERVELVFDGLDTYASVWLNGEFLGNSRNMFVAARFDVGPLLHDDVPNQVLVCFTPPAIAAAGKEMATWDLLADPIKTSKRHFHRKAQFGWGWDWGPSLPTVGIWRPARLERHHIASLDSVHFTTESIGTVARVAIELNIDPFAVQDETLDAAITLLAPDGSVAATQTFDWDLASRSARITLDIDNPKLWWTHELGEPSLYTLQIELAHAGRMVDQRAIRVGIRTIALDTSPDPDEPGCDFFRFVLNGVPAFMRGVNWIPASSFVGAVQVDEYRRLLTDAAAANINMVRVWGGGVYETEGFYDTCDELGIMVWQDFMFACAPYPEHDTALIDSISAEVAYQVDRLRNHPCIALWCGENEGHAVHQFLAMQGTESGPYPGALIFDQLIPAILERLDPATPYRPGSPFGGPSHNSMRAGDEHNWTVWHGVPPIPDKLPAGERDGSPVGVAYTRYAEDRARFVSEFGIQSAPAATTLARWLAPEDYALGTPGFLHRLKDHPKDKVDAMLLPVTGLPADLDQYVDFTQLVQAEGLKFGIEHYRRRKPHCSGTLIWQFNDCWPGITWSLVDYDGARKPSWYYVARAYSPVLGSLKITDDGTLELWVTNDTLNEVKSDATLTLTDLSGLTFNEQMIEWCVPANASVVVWRSTRAKIGAAPNRVLAVRSPRFPGNRLLFGPFKELLGTGADPRIMIEDEANEMLRVTLTGTHYHPIVHLHSDDPAVKFSDNCFDLGKHETRTVRVFRPGAKLCVNDIRLGKLPR
ncbi:beta-mannosidase [Paraburkholderia sp.]|jgi:beta-mannosidase